MFALICSYFLVYRYTGETRNRELRQSRISVSTPAVPPNSSLSRLRFSYPFVFQRYNKGISRGTAIIVLKIEEVLRGQGQKSRVVSVAYERSKICMVFKGAAFFQFSVLLLPRRSWGAK